MEATILGVVGTVLGLVGTVVAMIVSLKNIDRSKHQDSKEEGSYVGEVLTKLGYMETNLDRIYNKVDRLEQNYVSQANAIATLNSYKSVIDNHLNDIDRTIASHEKSISLLTEIINKINKD